MIGRTITSKAVVRLLLNFCLLLLPLLESVIVLCFVVRYFMSILVLQSSWWGRESWLLCLICLPGVTWWLSGSSLRCHGVVCSLWLWYFLIILTYYFSCKIILVKPQRQAPVRQLNRTHDIFLSVILMVNILSRRKSKRLCFFVCLTYPNYLLSH